MPMTRDDLRARIADLSVWSHGSQRAPHKPLLLLWALGRLSRGEDRLLPYAAVDAGLRPLLQEFGPPRKSYHPEYPFWYLRNDGLWEVTGVEGARVREGKSSEPTKSELVRLDAHGGLATDAYQLLKDDPALVREAAHVLLEAHFPETSHADIMAAVGLDHMEVIRVRRKRDPRFRDRVLVAYGYRCAVCGFDARLGHAPVGVEAAHIKWHQAKGPDIVPNGLALCSLHHKLFDRGAFTVEDGGQVAVSPIVNGSEVTQRLVVEYHGTEIQAPRTSSDAPGPDYIAWHRREVFQE